MEDLFDPATAERFRVRIRSVTAASQRQWGKMSAAQMMEHCARGLEMATGELKPPRALIGRLLGRVVKPMALKEGEPMRRNSPTSPALIVAPDADLEGSRTRLLGALDRVVAGGERGCSRHPHTFFGPLQPKEWSMLMYKHLDHHLRQFGA
ncbi:MAG TPA: DUF1569 domain-containing protein [Candidatus Aquilonibacter sp.]|nr:DUF1569 domain-containing protein [Candidatus Aquilonibacter sp.]